MHTEFCHKMKFMKKTISTISLAVLLIFSSCGPSDEDKARVKMNLARALLQQSDTVNALLHLDSIARLYPKAVYSINAAKNLNYEILWEIINRKQAELDSLSKLLISCEVNFEKVKTQFDRYTQYVHKRQNFDRSWDRSFIRVNLDEKGEISLTSNYSGQDWLYHTAVKVYDKDDQASTAEIPEGDIDNHRSDFMEAKWEKVTYRNGKDNGVIEFIAANTGRKLKAVFLGKNNYYIVLEDYDKMAIKEALVLSKAIKKKALLENEIKVLKKNLNIQ